ncbi:MAG: DNA polymerase I [Verrucomicrobiaceae bacterium]|nr:DNA polymerase I [Verrucomicrobiaceae bacterium]
MAGKLFLLDGMALLYRAHFAFARSPILTSSGVNTSAVFGFVNTLLDIVNNQKPTHLAVALDTSAPTPRHEWFPAYKAQRDAMPEDLAAAIPMLKRLCAAMNIPLLIHDGFEADDIIGTIAKRAEQDGFETWMVTPDKDFGQLVTEHVKIWKPGRQGGEVERIGIDEVKQRWGIEHPSQVIDVLALMGDASDNIPGVKGIGEKTAVSIIQTWGTVENALENASKIKGKTGEKLTADKDMALLSKRLVTIFTDAPVTTDISDLTIKPYDDEALKSLIVEWEFNALGKRLFGADFKAGRGEGRQGEVAPTTSDEPAPQQTPLRTITDVPHSYRQISTASERKAFIQELLQQSRFCFDLETTSLDPREAEIVGIAFSWKAGEGYFVMFSDSGKSGVDAADTGLGLFEWGSAAHAQQKEGASLDEFRQAFTRPGVEKVGHNLKFDLAVLRERGLVVEGPFFDTMLAHALVEPESRHGMDFLSELYLRYSPISIGTLIGEKKDGQISMSVVARDNPQLLTDYAAEDADVTWQLSQLLRPELETKGQHDVFYEIEAPLLPVLVKMEAEGVAIDVQALREFGLQLEKEANSLERSIQSCSEVPFNINSPKQLGELLFDKLKLAEKPKKTATGQYQTNEQVLQSLLGTHEIIQQILDYREVTKLRSTYVEALPQAISRKTGRVHTTLHQLMTATGRIASSDPNLQNIPVRSEHGKEIRRAFIPAKPDLVLMSADYSQVELRVMASLSEDPAMMDAFELGQDIHEATAARVYGVQPEDVLPEMRRTAKMVNFGIIYGISAFGLSQRLSIPRGEAARIIESYFAQFPGVKRYLDQTVESAKANGYVETMTGRRRYLRDINSANGTIRAAAERIAMNTPIQGTAADMIKLAMVRVDAALSLGHFSTKMLLQVHDELLFEGPVHEIETIRPLVIEAMRNALPLKVPVVVDVGTGKNWLEAH